ncbi:hypothetical protein ACIOG8_10215 [Streptomyces erythrochromogenes]|uniref:hypothetical protein n=1 Tax=Streptomyces erythrochromogenes TaxID=285574 RepID=UPI0038167CB0
MLGAAFVLKAQGQGGSSALALGWLGPALNLPQAALNLRPFAHLRRIPGAEHLSWAPLLALTALAAALTAAGLTALRRRDMTT